MAAVIALKRSGHAEGRRATILEAALHVIAEHGLSATTMERVARRAGISPGTVTFHFARKEALLLAALDHVVELFEAARHRALAEAGDDPARALDNLVEASFDPKVSAPEQIAVWTAFWGEAKARRLYMQRVGRADAAFHDDLVVLVGRMLERRPGPAASQREIEALALGFAGLIDGLWQEALVEGRRFRRSEARRLARGYLAAVFPQEPLWRGASSNET